ncbi:hypothetical protein RDI58_030081 [Solanum bulbocastanum]|uniref:DUF8018 domain-containing protein n=1 Tax=Solanum bulbocastanum TaxID=147425 RepID=A0AAN8SXZ8_SOLBU
MRVHEGGDSQGECRPEQEGAKPATVSPGGSVEVKVDIIRRMAPLDPEGDWEQRGARALDNPRTATGEELLERLYTLLEDLNRGCAESNLLPFFSVAEKRSLPLAFENDEYEVREAAGTMDPLTPNRSREILSRAPKPNSLFDYHQPEATLRGTHFGLLIPFSDRFEALAKIKLIYLIFKDEIDAVFLVLGRARQPHAEESRPFKISARAFLSSAIRLSCFSVIRKSFSSVVPVQQSESRIPEPGRKEFAAKRASEGVGRGETLTERGSTAATGNQSQRLGVSPSPGIKLCFDGAAHATSVISSLVDSCFHHR